jgi:hypothetical protein
MTAAPGGLPAPEPHAAVVHPASLTPPPASRGAKLNEWLASRLAMVFGLAWTIWAFATVPLLVLLAPSPVRSVVFYLASGWIQLWALPLFVYTGQKLQKTSDAQSDAQHAALTHIAGIVDDLLAILHPEPPDIRPPL